MKIISIFICVCIFFITSNGQNAEIEIKGTVNDINTQAPLVNVNIKLKDKNLGAVTNDLGQFYLISNKLPITLVFTHVGYEDQEYTVEFEPLQPLTIKMQSKSELLQGVVITTEKIDTVYKDRHYSVLDYELLQEGILLLIYRYTLNRSELLFKDYHGNKITLMNTLPGKPLRLFKDCLGEVHLFTKNKSYQIIFGKEKLELFPAIALDDFFQIMQYCEVFSNGKLYYHEKGYLDLINTYYSIDTNTKQQTLLHTVLDQEKLDFLIYNPENLSILNTDFASSLSQLSGMSSDKKIIDEIRRIEVELRFNQMAYFPAIFAPIFQLGDSIVIFNHPNSTIDFFNDQDTLIETISINYHKSTNKDIQGMISSIARSNKWQEEIFIDRYTKRAYTSFINLNGTKTIKEIDLNTGKLIRFIRIPFPYVEKIQFRNGFIYYIYKGWGEAQKKKLFRQQID